MLIDAASALITLTDQAADILTRDFGAGDVRVVPHPRIVEEPVEVERGDHAAVFLKSVRSNVVADAQFYRDIAARVPLDVYVHGGAELASIGTVVHEPMTDDELHAAVGRAGVCILPYTRGTHSGWLEMCRDLGVPVAVPDCGCYAGQADTDAAVEVYRTGDGRSAGEAAARLLARGPVPYAGDRARQLDEVRRAHEEIYRKVVSE